MSKETYYRGLTSIQVRLRLPGAGLSCSRLRAPSGQESDPPPASHHCRPRVAAAARRGVAHLLMNSPVSRFAQRSPASLPSSVISSPPGEPPQSWLESGAWIAVYDLRTSRSADVRRSYTECVDGAVKFVPTSVQVRAYLGAHHFRELFCHGAR